MPQADQRPGADHQECQGGRPGEQSRGADGAACTGQVSCPVPRGRHRQRASDAAGTAIYIYDVTGKLFLKQTLKSQVSSINLNNLPNGMYFLKAETSNSPKVFKLIKHQL